MRALLLLVLLSLLAGSVYLVKEGVSREERLRQLVQQVGVLKLALSGERDRLSAAEKVRVDLERELAGALGQRDQFHQVLAARVDEVIARREARAKRQAASVRGMPEAVRLALVAFNRCLAEDGFPEVRMLWARELDGRELRDVELMEHHRESLKTTVYLAGRVSLRFDRELGQLSVHLLGGHRLAGDGRVELSEEGQVLEFAGLDGPKWEARLGYLMEVVGAYPAADVGPSPGPSLTEPERGAWLDRFERLLRAAGTDVAYRVERVGGLRDGSFADVVLLGYQGGRALKIAIEAASMQVAVDRRDGTVALVMRGGVLRKAGGETGIGDEGYRILLPEVSRELAMEVMMGMVVELD